jgi:hypothetical protein
MYHIITVCMGLIHHRVCETSGGRWPWPQPCKPAVNFVSAEDLPLIWALHAALHHPSLVIGDTALDIRCIAHQLPVGNAHALHSITQCEIQPSARLQPLRSHSYPTPPTAWVPQAPPSPSPSPQPPLSPTHQTHHQQHLQQLLSRLCQAGQVGVVAVRHPAVAAVHCPPCQDLHPPRGLAPQVVGVPMPVAAPQVAAAAHRQVL